MGAVRLGGESGAGDGGIMSRIPGLRRYFRLPLSRDTLGRDIADELGFHLEMRGAELEAAGLGAAEAEAQARREFGDVNDARRELERMGRGRLRRQSVADLGDMWGQNIHWRFACWYGSRACRWRSSWRWRRVSA
jgi:hypothetical protein